MLRLIWIAGVRQCDRGCRGLALAVASDETGAARFVHSLCLQLRFGVQFHPEKNAFEHGQIPQGIVQMPD